MSIEQVLVGVDQLYRYISIAKQLHVLHDTALLVNPHHIDVFCARVLHYLKVAQVAFSYFIYVLVDPWNFTNTDY